MCFVEEDKFDELDELDCSWREFVFAWGEVCFEVVLVKEILSSYPFSFVNSFEDIHLALVVLVLIGWREFH